MRSFLQACSHNCSKNTLGVRFRTIALQTPYRKGPWICPVYSKCHRLYPCLMLFDGLDDLFFGITFLHVEISISSRVLEISSMSWSKFGRKVNVIPL